MCDTIFVILLYRISLLKVGEMQCGFLSLAGSYKLTCCITKIVETNDIMQAHALLCQSLLQFR